MLQHINNFDKGILKNDNEVDELIGIKVSVKTKLYLCAILDFYDRSSIAYVLSNRKILSLLGDCFICHGIPVNPALCAPRSGCGVD